MTAVLPRTAPAARTTSATHVTGPVPPTRAVAYQRVLHEVVRREWRLLAELSTWAPAAESRRTAALTSHAELISRVLLHHHAVERDRLWPALHRARPDDEQLRAAIRDWTDRCSRIDHMLRDVATAARQWAVTGTDRARDTFAMACLDLANAVDAQTAEEERALLPLLARHLDRLEWAAVRRAARSPLSVREQLLVLGLVLEDACAADRARLLDGLDRAARWAWRITGRRRYRAAVVRLRGEPPPA